jgi:hypothetical protein
MVSWYVPLVVPGSGKAGLEGAAMAEGGTQEPSSDPFEEAYVAYIRAVQSAWADVRVEAVVSEARRHGHLHSMGCWACFACYDCRGAGVGPADLSIMPMGCWSCLAVIPLACWACIGGSPFTHGTHGDSASPGPAEPTER